MDKPNFDFSFSGLKTSLRYLLDVGKLLGNIQFFLS